MTPPAVLERPSFDSSTASPTPSPRLRTTRPSGADAAVVELVRAARAGDDHAWERLVDRFSPMLRGIARSYRLSPSDIEDVLQNTWLRLFNHIDRVREPTAIAGWLATTTRRECLRLLQLPTRECPTADPDLGDSGDSLDPERELLAAERRMVLGRALATLPERHRKLMTLIVAQPDNDYEQLSAILAMPVGSIGPIRARSLARLRRHPELSGFCGGDA
jgi:RNA polymerase sigma factor (sigma-70 family)